MSADDPRPDPPEAEDLTADPAPGPVPTLEELDARRRALNARIEAHLRALRRAGP